MSYTYLIGWSRLGTWYYGVRFAKGCSLDDLWTKYFTSSNRVKKFRATYGEPDVVEIRQVFDDKAAAQSWERRLLRRIKAVKSPYWLNANDTFRYDFEITPELLAKRGAGIKAHWDSMDHGAREARVTRRREAWQRAYDNMDVEKRKIFEDISKQKIAAVNSQPLEIRSANARAGAEALKAKIAGMTDEERRAYFNSQVETRKKTFASMDPVDKAAWREKTSASWTEEMKESAATRTRQWQLERHAAMTPAEREQWREKLKGKRKSPNMTPEQLAARGKKISEAAARRRAEKAAALNT